MNKFQILTPAFNCEEKIMTTLYSIAGQTYQKWRLTIIDDVSTDNTRLVIKDFAKRNSLEHKISIKCRTEKYGEVRNTFEECNHYDENDIVVRIDAGDWLTDLGCLEYLNALYCTHDPAVLWTAHRWAFSDHNISGPIDPSVSIYEQPWKSSHLKTFRVNAFKGINKNNFLDDDGNWIMIACDQAVFLPMMEHARRNQRKLVFFPRVMYHYDIDLQDKNLFMHQRSVDQKMSAEYLRKRGYLE
jgi:glycosyltransferase involved in cell wall biosynthesis